MIYETEIEFLPRLQVIIWLYIQNTYYIGAAFPNSSYYFLSFQQFSINEN